MNRVVIDVSIAMKWVVEEDGTREAPLLLQRARLIAPDQPVAECANVLRKKVRQNELSKKEALLAAGLLEVAEIELLPTRSLLARATRMAIGPDHPANERLYLAVAVPNDCRFVTTDERFRRRVDARETVGLRGRVMSLTEAAAGTG